MLININQPFLNAVIWHQDLIGQLRLQSQTLRGTRPKAAKMIKIHVKQSNRESNESIKKREVEQDFMKKSNEGGSLLNDALCHLITTKQHGYTCVYAFLDYLKSFCFM